MMRRINVLHVPCLGVIEGLSCAIELFCRYGLAATLGQHCPYLTPRLCTYVLPSPKMKM